MPNLDLFKNLRKALNHLYNPDYLRTCPLVYVLGIAGQYNTPKVFQKILIQAIELVKISPGGARDERRVFYHDLLYYRYIQKLSQEEVAGQLGVSMRQFCREQDHAIDLLAMVLTEKYASLARAWSDAVPPGPGAEQPAARGENSPGAGEGQPEPGGDIGGEEQVPSELIWLDSAQTGQPVSTQADLDIVLDLVAPLAGQNQVSIMTQLDAPFASLAIHPVAFRQVLLSILTVAIHYARQNRILVRVFRTNGRLGISVQSERARPAAYQESGDEDQAVSQDQVGVVVAPSAEDLAGLEQAQELARMNEGSLEVSYPQGGFRAGLALEVFEEKIVLVVDDNPDFHQLIQRFTSGTHYQVVCTAHPGEAIELATRLCAQVILLDVMMPEVDGWQVLSQLRRHPQTSQIPVVICTIVAQEGLAYSLGASGFLRKPVTREMLLEALDWALKKKRD